MMVWWEAAADDRFLLSFLSIPSFLSPSPFFVSLLVLVACARLAIAYPRTSSYLASRPPSLARSLAPFLQCADSSNEKPKIFIDVSNSTNPLFPVSNPNSPLLPLLLLLHLLLPLLHLSNRFSQHFDLNIQQLSNWQLD